MIKSFVLFLILLLLCLWVIVGKHYATGLFAYLNKLFKELFTK